MAKIISNKNYANGKNSRSRTTKTENNQKDGSGNNGLRLTKE